MKNVLMIAMRLDMEAPQKLVCFYNVKYHELSVLSNSWTQSYSFLMYLNKNIEYWGKH